jgi:hypothetical protein
MEEDFKQDGSIYRNQQLSQNGDKLPEPLMLCIGGTTITTVKHQPR